MTKTLSLVMLSFAVFGCATVSDCPETPTAAIPETKITAVQSENVPLNTGTNLDNAGIRDPKRTLSETLNTEQVRQVQTLLKTTGFDPGRIDGAFGPKTKVALLRLRSSCSGLSDLLQAVALDKIAPSIESSGNDRSGTGKATQRKEDIRVIQVRLKDAGFDPGTVDGITGPNTRAAVTRFRSGCRGLNAMPPAVLEVAASADESDKSGPTVARKGMTADAVLRGGGEHSNSSPFNGAAINESRANKIRRPPNPRKDIASSAASLDVDAGEKPEIRLRRRDATGANRSSPARSSSAVPTIQY
jgi:peptidoglycan hydrolase-like protein with peptidoglycan-binding domain